MVSLEFNIIKIHRSEMNTKIEKPDNEECTAPLCPSPSIIKASYRCEHLKAAPNGELFDDDVGFFIYRIRENFMRII